MKLFVTEVDGSSWDAEVEDCTTADVINAMQNHGGTPQILVFEAPNSGSVVVNLQHIKNFRLLKEDNVH
jgi:predicted GNAT superfamily acetyltransferase